MDAEQSCGWRFPVGVDARTGKIKTTDEALDIRQSLLILLRTLPGERDLHADYGCNLHRFVFEPVAYRLLQEIRTEVTRRIVRWEKRVAAVAVDALPTAETETSLVVTIRYTVQSTGERDQIEYSLNLLEAAGRGR